MFEHLPPLPDKYAAIRDWPWDNYAPYAEALLAAPLTDQTADAWLKAYSQLARMLAEVYSRLSIEYTQDTGDAEREARYNHFLEAMLPKLLEFQNAAQKAIVASGVTPPGFEVVLRNMRADLEIFRPENLPLISEEQKNGAEYDKTSGAQTFQWGGEEVTIVKTTPLMQGLARAEREALWRAAAGRQLQDREALNELWIKNLQLRQKMAANAGYSSYLDYIWKARKRFDYTPADCQTFRDAIEQVVVPAAGRLYERYRQAFGYDSLRPWDMRIDYAHEVALDPHGRPALRPYDSIDELNSKMSAIFHRVAPDLGGYYDDMRTKNLLDLENRKGKAPGGYCSSYPMEHVPFIFMNAVGLHNDVQTLLHEGGHAFHVYEMRDLPYFDQQDQPIEFAEVASMSMELLAAPYLAASQGGYYSEADAARARIEHLESMILFWPYMAVVDGFQHWAYSHPDQAADPRNCDAAWADLWGRFLPAIDYSGLEEVKATGWHRKLHIFRVPFYYIEYGLAQLGASQVYANSLKDQAAAIAQYRRGLSLGYTATLPGLFAAAGAKFAFDAPTLKTAVDLIENTIGELLAVH
jgi:oligoendopeptidase F